MSHSPYAVKHQAEIGLMHHLAEVLQLLDNKQNFPQTIRISNLLEHIPLNITIFYVCTGDNHRPLVQICTVLKEDTPRHKPLYFIWLKFLFEPQITNIIAADMKTYHTTDSDCRQVLPNTTVNFIDFS